MKKAELEALSRAPEAVFRLWRNRQMIEIEAANLFSKLADGLFILWGPNDEVAQLARLAAEDERKHAEYCQAVLDHSSRPRAPIFPEHPIQLGPHGLSLEDQVLYACVAICCVTETLSTALLIEMYQDAAPGLIKETIHKILADEVNHSRIGWAELARVEKSRELGWIADHLPKMIQAALISDVGPMLDASEALTDMSAWGVLPPSRANAIVTQALKEVVFPGLRHNRIDTTQAERELNLMIRL